MTSAPAKSAAEILRAIGCRQLALYRCVGEGYWYFIFDDLAGTGTYESKSVYVPRLNDMSVERWVEIGLAFALECGGACR